MAEADQANSAAEPQQESQGSEEQIEIVNQATGAVQARDATITNSFAGTVIARANASLKSSGAAVMVAGGDMKVDKGAGTLLIAGQNLEVRMGGGALMFAGNAKLEKSRVGVLIAGNAEMLEESQTVFTILPALALGASFGAAFAILNWLLRRKR